MGRAPAVARSKHSAPQAWADNDAASCMQRHGQSNVKCCKFALLASRTSRFRPSGWRRKSVPCDASRNSSTCRPHSRRAQACNVSGPQLCGARACSACTRGGGEAASRCQGKEHIQLEPCNCCVWSAYHPGPLTGTTVKNLRVAVPCTPSSICSQNVRLQSRTGKQGWVCRRHAVGG